MILRFGRGSMASSFLVLAETWAAAADPAAKFVSATGTLQPVEVVDITTRAAGVITQINVEANAVVKQGELLAKLDARPAQIKFDRARANLQRTEAGIQIAKAKLAQTEADYQRSAKLMESSAIDRATFEAARQAVDSARAAIAVEESNVVLARCDVEAAQLELEDCQIRAPRDGVILQRHCTVGANVGGGAAPPLFVLAQDFSILQLYAKVAESEVGLIQAGQTVQVSVPAFPDVTFAGRVRQLSLQPRGEGQSFRVLIDVPNPNRKLLPYLNAEAKIGVLPRNQ